MILGVSMKNFTYRILAGLISLPSYMPEVGWGLKTRPQQPDIGIYAQEIEGTSSYYVGPKDEKIVFLTFDAGYDNGGLMKILDVLDEKNVKSTFFVTGDFIERESELLMEIIWRGHLVETIPGAIRTSRSFRKKGGG